MDTKLGKRQNMILRATKVEDELFGFVYEIDHYKEMEELRDIREKALELMGLIRLYRYNVLLPNSSASERIAESNHPYHKNFHKLCEGA